MKLFNLSENELERVKRAADATGFPWQPIAERPRTARRFYRRVETELARKAGQPNRSSTARIVGLNPLLAAA